MVLKIIILNSSNNGYTNLICEGQPNNNRGVICAKNCTLGSYKTGMFNQTCSVCPANLFSDSWNSKTCFCPASTFLHPSSQNCTTCDPGKYTDTKNTFSSCLDCPYGEGSFNGTCIPCNEDCAD